MENKKILAEIKQGNRETIVSALNHKGAIYRVNAIINVVRHTLNSTDIISNLETLCKDDTFFNGYTVSDFAIAALDLISVKKYNGKNINVINLINSKFEF